MKGHELLTDMQKVVALSGADAKWPEVIVGNNFN